jgi:23S rRNA pseudouridine1911/1915/1917 synthase
MPQSHHLPVERLTAEAEESHVNMRLDLFLSGMLPELSRTRVQALIRDGQVASSGATIEDVKYRVKPGESFELCLPPVADTTIGAEAIPLNVVYEDDALIVID